MNFYTFEDILSHRVYNELGLGMWQVYALDPSLMDIRDRHQAGATIDQVYEEIKTRLFDGGKLAQVMAPVDDTHFYSCILDIDSCRQCTEIEKRHA